MLIPSDTVLYEHSMATLWFTDSGILCSVSKDGSRTIEKFDSYIAFIKEITDNKLVCILSDISKASPMDSATRNYAALNLPQVYKAMAILSETPMGEVVGKVFLQLETQPYPVKMFNNEEAADLWLKQYL